MLDAALTERLSTVILGFLVVSLTVHYVAGAEQGRMCFGRQATIVGSDPGPATIRGTPRADVILGTVYGDKIRGLGGNDRVCSGGGDDYVFGGSGRDRIAGAKTVIRN